MTPEIRQTLNRYFREHKVPEELIAPADVVVALLRLGFRREAEVVMGKPIKVCPPAIPPWPPKPVVRKFRPGMICRVAENPFGARTKSHQKFKKIKKGMTRDDVICCGVTYQQIYKWTKAGYMEFSR